MTCLWLYSARAGYEVEKMANRGFYLMDAYLTRTAKLTDEQMGKLMRACMIYHATGKEIELDVAESVAFDFIREDIDAQSKAYQAKCETNRRNRMNGAQRSSTIVDDGQREATAVHKGKVKVNVKEKERCPSDTIRERFDRFWAAYPRKENKQRARGEFEKLAPDDEMLNAMLMAIERQKCSDQWQEAGGRYIPHPASWLHGKRWEDEPIRTQSGGYSQREYKGAEKSVDELMAQLAAI